MIRKHLFVLLVLVSFTGAICAQNGDFSISPMELEPVSATVGDSAIAAQFIVRHIGFSAPVYLRIEGKDSTMFRLDADSATSYVDVIHAWYVPTQAGKHQAYVIADCPALPARRDTVRFEGTATDPTGIYNVSPEHPSASRKIMQDGAFFIQTPQGTYTLTGAVIPR